MTAKLAKCKLRKGDEVVILTGKCRGETGKIDRIDLKKQRVVVSGKNLYKKHAKPDAGSNQDGGIIDKTMPLHISNVGLLDPKTKKPTRIGYRIEDGKKVRFAKASGTVL